MVQTVKALSLTGALTMLENQGITKVGKATRIKGIWTVYFVREN